jgi:hypothetical protein
MHGTDLEANEWVDVSFDGIDLAVERVDRR